MSDEKKNEMSEMNDVKDINDILKLMNRVNEVFAYEVWIPSLEKNVMFRELNTSQQKRLIKSVIDSPIFNTEFIFTITQIIKENCAEKIDINSLTVLDKLFICIKMREVSVNDTLELEYKIKGVSHKRGVSLEKIYEEAKDKIDYTKLKPIKVNDDVYTISCCIPTIKTEYTLEKEMRGKTQDLNVKRTPEMMRQVIGDMFINELIKYISDISIKTEDEIVNIDFNDAINYTNRISIIEQLPMKLLEKVIQYIKTIRQEIEKVQIVEFEVDDKKIREVLTIDGNFFINS